MNLVTLCPRQSVALTMSAAIQSAGLCPKMHLSDSDLLLTYLPDSSIDGILISSESLVNPTLFHNLRQTLPTAKIVLCLLPDSNQPIETIWPVLDIVPFDLLCQFDELPDCLTALKAGRFYASALLATNPVKIKKKETSPGFDELTPAELRVLGLMMHGLKGPVIAEKLFISIHTVNNHKAAIARKLGVPGGQGELPGFIMRNVLILNRLMKQ